MNESILRLWHDVLLEFSNTLLIKQKIEILFLYHYLPLRESKNFRAEWLLISQPFYLQNKATQAHCDEVTWSR